METQSTDEVSKIASSYPFQHSDFYKSSMGYLPEINTQKDKNCILLEKWSQTCSAAVPNGYHKPLNEKCPAITGALDFGPDKGCTSIWNNMTKRKSVVKDY
jgi:hypothetical protein